MVQPDWRTEPGRNYESVLRLRKDAPPLGLVRYMYSTSPENAVRIRVYADEMPDERQLIWRVHCVSEYHWRKQNRFEEARKEALASALRETEVLARHGEWWVRLYAAEVLSRHSELGSEEFIRLLRTDSHELVRKEMAR